MSTARRLAAIAVGVGAAAALAALTRVPYATHAPGALLRLSWRARGESMEHCRRATEEELAAVAAHMRQPIVCEGRRVASYRLRAVVDGHAWLDGPMPGSGTPGERPMFVLRDMPLVAGAHHVQVRLEREGTRAAEDTLAARERMRRAIPPLLALDTTVDAAHGAVLLVTYDPDARQLVLLGGEDESAARPFRP